MVVSGSRRIKIVRVATRGKKGSTKWQVREVQNLLRILQFLGKFFKRKSTGNRY